MHPNNSSGESSGAQFGEPDEWEFDYPWEVIKDSMWLWSMSGFQHLYNQDEIMAFDPRYISDMRLAYRLYSHQGNQTAPMKLLEQWQSLNQGNEDAKSSISSLFSGSNKGQIVTEVVPTAQREEQERLEGRGRMTNIGRFLKRGR